MSGFKNEKQLWKWMRPRMRGTWHRVEAITPDGFPDLIGSHNSNIVFIELKVLSEIRPSQSKFMKWLVSNGAYILVAYGSPKEKSVIFVGSDGCPTRPAFWGD